MLQMKDMSKPSFLVEKDGQITLFSGVFKELQTFAELEQLKETHDQQVAFAIPFSAASENQMDVLGDEKILAIAIQSQQDITPSELDAICAGGDITFKTPFQATISDTDFAAEVVRIQMDEIAAGNACQVIFSRKFEATFESMSPEIPLILFARLLKQQGQFLTFLFSDGQGRYFVGASPERQLEILKDLGSFIQDLVGVIDFPCLVQKNLKEWRVT